MGTTIGDIKGDTRSLDNGSYGRVTGLRLYEQELFVLWEDAAQSVLSFGLKGAWLVSLSWGLKHMGVCRRTVAWPGRHDIIIMYVITAVVIIIDIVTIMIITTITIRYRRL